MLERSSGVGLLESVGWERSRWYIVLDSVGGPSGACTGAGENYYLWRGTAHWDGCWCFWAVLEGSFGFGTALDLVGGCDGAVLEEVFACRTAFEV